MMLGLKSLLLLLLVVVVADERGGRTLNGSRATHFSSRPS